MYIDTHAHLWFEDYQTDLESVINYAKESGVAKMVVPGTDIESSKQAVELAKKYPGVICAAVGVHPEELLNQKSSDLSFAPLSTAERSELLEHAVAIGEIGTDASTEELMDCMEAQKELFKMQCELALKYDLPVIIHTRESLDEAIEVLDSLPQMPRGQFHCFSHDEDGIKLVLERGFYVSFCGNISWSKRVRKLITLVPDERLLLETDSPFMVPRDKGGNPFMITGRVAPSSATRELPSGNIQGDKSSDLSFAPLSTALRSELSRNEPANVVYLAKIIAESRNQDLKQIEEMTTENAKRLFRL